MVICLSSKTLMNDKQFDSILSSDFLKGEFREELHPRDEHGRFSGGGEPIGSVKTTNAMMARANNDNSLVVNRSEHGGNNSKVIEVEFKDGTRAYYKPQQPNEYKYIAEEAPDMAMNVRDSMDQKVPQYQRSLATADLDREMGFGVVPPTELVDYGQGVGSAMGKVYGIHYADAVAQGSGPNRSMYDDATFQQIATLDFISGNTDRHGHNFMLGNDDRWYAIDNDLTWPKDSTFNEFRSIPIEKMAANYVDFHPSIIAPIKNLTSDRLGEILSKRGIDKKSIAAAQDRLHTLKTMTSWADFE